MLEPQWSATLDRSFSRKWRPAISPHGNYVFFLFCPPSIAILFRCDAHIDLFSFQNNSYPRLRKWRQNKLRRNIMTSRSRGCEVMTLKEMEPKQHLKRRREFSFLRCKSLNKYLADEGSHWTPFAETSAAMTEFVLIRTDVCNWNKWRGAMFNVQWLNERRFFLKTQGFCASVLLSQHLLIYDLLLRVIYTANFFFLFLINVCCPIGWSDVESWVSVGSAHGRVCVSSHFRKLTVCWIVGRTAPFFICLCRT